MAKSIKYTNNTYLDSTGVVHDKTLLSEVLNNINLDISNIENMKLLANPDGWVMNGSQSVNLSENITNQTNGIILVWSAYSNGQAQNWWWNFNVIPKYWVNHNGGGNGVTCPMFGGSFSSPCAKYVYISNNKISGHNDNSQSGTANGITYNNGAYVLRYVLGF